MRCHLGTLSNARSSAVVIKLFVSSLLFDQESGKRRDSDFFPLLISLVSFSVSTVPRFYVATSSLR